MNILVTGGAGFIGANFVEYYLDKYPDDKVVVFDKLTYAANLNNLRKSFVRYGDNRLMFVRGDIADKKFLEETLLQYNIAEVINFAAETHVDRSFDNPRPFFGTNVIGVLNLIELVKELGFSMHHVSTDEVYGEIFTGSFDESAPYNPSNPYSKTKAIADQLINLSNIIDNSNITITRCTNNVGPYQHPEKALPKFIRSALNDMPITVYGDGLHERDYIHVSDHIRAIDLVLNNGTGGEVYNVGSGYGISTLKLAKIVLKSLGKENGEITNVQDRPYNDRRYSLNTTKIKGLGWLPKLSAESAIGWTIQWYLNNKRWLVCDW